MSGWAELRHRPATLPVLLACAVVLVVHQATRADWFIDDAAICFAYARNLATGEGLVPWPGGERVEAYSDPTWVALLAAAYALGLDGFVIAKPLGMLFGVASLLPAWRLARRAMPGHEGDGALLAPLALALNPQFAIWGASGLENALFSFLLALLLERAVRESHADRTRYGPGAALAGLLLVWTRPEGIAHVAMVGGWLAVFGWRSGRGWRPALRFAAIVLVPSALLEVARLAYFAWPLPNPFYAKIASHGVRPLDWQSRGWVQLRQWATRLGHVYYLPVYAVALVGTSRHARIGLAAVGLLALTLLWPMPDAITRLTGVPDVLPPPPRAFVVGRLLAIGLVLVGLPLLGLGRPGGRTTVLCGHAVVVGLLFAVGVNGDWMGAHRFMSLIAVPLSVLLAVGITRAAEGLQHLATGHTRLGDVGWVAVSVLTGGLLGPSFSQTRDHILYNANETVASVKQRVDHTREVLRTTFWTEPVTTLEIDQGAHLWWAPDYRSLDMGMLVDIAMGRHWYQQRAFIEEYVYEEHRPTFAHVRGWWARHTGLRTYPPFVRGDYVELPPYIDLRDGQPYPNVYVHRRLIVAPPGELPLTPMGDGFAHGPARVPSWAPGTDGYLEVPLQVPVSTDPTVWVGLLDADRVQARFPVRLGYGLLSPADARPGEVFRNRFAVEVPRGLRPGTTLALAIAWTEHGPWQRVGADVHVRTTDDVSSDRIETEVASVAQAHADHCARAEQTAVWASRYTPRDAHASSRSPLRPVDRGAIAACWARRAAAAWPTDRPTALDALARAHHWDHHHHTLRALGGPIGRTLWTEGLAARDAKDWSTAYARFAALLRFQPWRAWARRYAEEARDHRLGLTDDIRIGLGGDDDRRRAEANEPVPPHPAAPPAVTTP